VLIPLGDDAPRRRLPIVTGAIIAVNVTFYLVWRLMPPDQGMRLLYLGGAVPHDVVHLAHPFAPFTLATSMVLHGGAPHLVGNAWFLWVFGKRVEQAMGSPRFLLFYQLVGILAALAQVVATPDSRVPMVGASGAIAGVLGAYFLLFPRARVQLVVFLVVVIQVVVVPAFVALGVWFLWQLISARESNASAPTVAFGAHLAGFLVGALLSKLFVRSWMEHRALASSSSPP
jgi:membrane associated rhomboid family serine protease